MSHMNQYTDEQLLRELMFIIHNAVEAICSGVPQRKQDEALDNLVNAHSAICKRLAQMQGEHNDSLQAPCPQLSAPAKSVVVSHPQDEETKLYERQLLRIIIERNTIPWDVEQSIKSIERRIQAAIKLRNFAKAERLNNVSVAIRCVHIYCQELINATR